MLHLKLKQCLREHHLTKAMLADAIAELSTGLEHPVSERYLRYLTQNVLPLTPTNPKQKPSLIILGIILRGLKTLTSKNVTLENILEDLNPSHTVLSNGAHKTSESPNVSDR